MCITDIVPSHICRPWRYGFQRRSPGWPMLGRIFNDQHERRPQYYFTQEFNNTKANWNGLDCALITRFCLKSSGIHSATAGIARITDLYLGNRCAILPSTCSWVMCIDWSFWPARWSCNCWIHSVREDFIALRAIVIAPWSAAWTCAAIEQIPPLATLWSSSRAGLLPKRRIFRGLSLRFGCRFILTCWSLSEWMARRGSRWRDTICITARLLANVTLPQASKALEGYQDLVATGNYLGPTDWMVFAAFSKKIKMGSG